jgi:hypothetical protein
MAFPKGFLDKIPKGLVDPIKEHEDYSFITEEKDLFPKLTTLRNDHTNKKYKWSLFLNTENVSEFNLSIFEEILKHTAEYGIIVISKNIYERNKIDGALVILDFYLAYKFLSEDKTQFVILIYEKLNPSRNEQKLFFKYNRDLKGNAELYFSDIDKYSLNIIKNSIELQRILPIVNRVSVRIILKLREILARIPGYAYWSRLIYRFLVIIAKILIGIYKFPKLVKKRIVESIRKKKSQEIRKFIKRQNNNLVIIYAGVQYVNNEGQRSVRLAQEFLRKKKNVLYVFWDYSTQDWSKYGQHKDNLYVVPRSQFLKYFNDFKKESLFDNSVLLIHVPDLEIAKLIPDFNALGGYSVYDILDDWEEFSKHGQSFWFNADIENFVLRNTTKRYAVSKGLIQKHCMFDIELLPNGLSTTHLKNRTKLKLKLGKRNVGYFGHLTDAWFDWDLILNVAKKDPETYFHIIGYGIPDNLNLPDNIIFYGKINPEELSGYVKNWDVCLIPFKDIALSKSVNPIKVYEYLYFEKPVVVTGIPGMEDFPYVYFSQNKTEEFLSKIDLALKQKIKTEKIKKFLAVNRWEDRAEVILAKKME